MNAQSLPSPTWRNLRQCVTAAVTGAAIALLTAVSRGRGPGVLPPGALGELADSTLRSLAASIDSGDALSAGIALCVALVAAVATRTPASPAAC